MGIKVDEKSSLSKLKSSGQLEKNLPYHKKYYKKNFYIRLVEESDNQES